MTTSRRDGDQSSRSTVALISDLLSGSSGHAISDSTDRFVTFEHLDTVTGRFAQALADMYPVGTRAFVVEHRTLESVILALSVMRSGLIFTPANPDQPWSSTVKFMQRSGGGVLVSSCQFAAPAELPECASWVEMRPSGKLGVRVRQNPARTYASSAAGIAYSIATGGSTGTPRLVNVGWDGLLPLGQALAERMQVSKGTRMLQFSSLAYDAAIGEIMTWLCSGSTLCIPQISRSWLRSVRHYLSTHRVGLAMIPPSAYRLLGSAAHSNIETVAFVGEKVLRSDWELASLFSRVFNGYGPTEATVGTTFGEMPCYSESVGRALPHLTLRVATAQHGLTPHGTGELVVRGPGVALGYEGESSDSFGVSHGLRTYRTGDMVTIERDGDVKYIGRIDDQLKRFGHRISASALEARWTEVLGERVWCIVANERAYLVTTAALDSQDAFAKLRFDAAPWETPDAVRSVGQLPVGLSGKLDRALLRDWLESE